jgi:hypothetical protein
MQPAKSHVVRWAAWAGVLACATGCAPSRISFEGPPGTVLFVDDKPYHIPTYVKFSRYAGNGEAHRYNVRLVFTMPAGDVHARGTIDIYGYTESDIDRIVINRCVFTDEQLASLAGGKILVYKGVTASKQPLFDLTLKRE